MQIETSHESWALKDVAAGKMALIGSEVTLFHFIGKQYLATGTCQYAVAKEDIIREVKNLAVRPGFPFLTRFNTMYVLVFACAMTCIRSKATLQRLMELLTKAWESSNRSLLYSQITSYGRDWTRHSLEEEVLAQG